MQAQKRAITYFEFSRWSSTAPSIWLQRGRHSGLGRDKRGLEGDYVIKAFGWKHGEAIISIHIFIVPPLCRSAPFGFCRYDSSLSVWWGSLWDYWVLSFSGSSRLCIVALNQRLQSESHWFFAVWKTKEKIEIKRLTACHLKKYISSNLITKKTLQDVLMSVFESHLCFGPR